MEHNPYDVHAEFWRDTYLAALQVGHRDPAAAADEAFMAFDSRFGEVEPVLLGEMATADGMVPIRYTMAFVDAAGVEYRPADPSTGGLPPPAEKSDDEVLG